MLRHAAWRGVLCLCAALAFNAVFGGSALAADSIIHDEAELIGYLSGSNTDIGVLDGDITLSGNGTMNVSGTKTLKGSKTIRRGLNLLTHLITVSSGASLTLENITLDGGNATPVTNVSGSLVYVESGGTLLMESGAVLCNNTVSSSTGGNRGGGVYNEGSFTMNGGAIHDCQAAGRDGQGGGVYNSKTFLMKNGTIRSNTAISSGGGVRNAGLNASFIMEGNGTIENNTAFNGGGVSNGADFTMSGGSINRNRAQKSAGGIIVDSGADFIMNGGSITGNASHTDAGQLSDYSNGGGVLVSFNGSITISGAPIITGNQKGTGSAATNNNIFLTSGMVVQWNAAPSAAPTFGVTTEDAPTASQPVHIVTNTGVQGLLPHVVSDNPLYRPKQGDSGNTASIFLTLRIDDIPYVPAPPKTGDNSRPAQWAALCLAAGAALVALALRRKKSCR